MPIRRSINLRKRVLYHRRYGSVENPPLSNQGPSGRTWPNGSAVMSNDVPRFRGQPVVVGWVCNLVGLRHFGLYVATRIGVAKPSMIGEPPALPKGKVYVDPKWEEPGSWKFLDIEPYTVHDYRLYDRLLEAFADHHELIM